MRRNDTLLLSTPLRRIGFRVSLIGMTQRLYNIVDASLWHGVKRGHADFIQPEIRVESFPMGTSNVDIS